MSALLRNSFEDYVIRNHKDARIKDVGGNYARHYSKHQGANIHTCAPFTCAEDIIREVTRGYCTQAPCRKTFEQCDAPYDVLLFNHSMYYIPQDSLCTVPAGTTIYASHHIYRRPGTYCAGEMIVHGDPDGWQVLARGNGRAYEHPECWLKGECVVPGFGCVIAFKIIATHETLTSFKGVAYKLSVDQTHYLAPEYAPEVPNHSPLEDYLLAETIGTTITPHTLHTLGMRARTYAQTHDMAVPTNLGQIISRVINRAAQQTLATHHGIDLPTVNAANAAMDEFITPPSVWTRTGGTLCNFVNGTARLLCYTSPVKMRHLTTLATNARATIIGSTTKAQQSFARAKLRALRWVTRLVHVSGVDAHPHVPSADWENELASLVQRVVPAAPPTHIDPKVPMAALDIAKLIGRIDTPVDFDQWVAKYPPARRKQISAALDEPYTTHADFFHKVEKLDQDKVPRAIQARNDAYKARVGPWVAAFEHRARQVLPLVKGLDDDGRAQRIQELRSRALNVLEIDYSRFDRHCSKELLESTEQLIYAYCLPRDIANMLHDQLHTICKTRHGLKYKLEGTRLSGDMNTSIGNCVVNLALIMAAGLPMDAVVVEGDDMFACPTNAELAQLNTSVITEAGHNPSIRINPPDGGTFCSRYDVPTALGPKRVRNLVRDLMRFGWALNSEDADELIETHWREWRGVPMLGPAYEDCMIHRGHDIERIPITPEARAAIHLIFNVNATQQQRFETDPATRAEIFARLQADIASEREHDSTVQRATQSRARGEDQDSPLLPGCIRTPTPGCQSSNVRNVPDQRTSPGGVQNRGSDHNSRRDCIRDRLRPERLQPELRCHRSTVTQDSGPSVEKHTPAGPSQHRNETEVVHNGDTPGHPNDDNSLGASDTQLALRHSGIRNTGDIHRKPKHRVALGGIRHRASVPEAPRRADRDEHRSLPRR